MPGHRELCLQEKGRQCHICGTGQDIVVHHIDGDRQNGDLENLVPLCDSCHLSIHNGADGFGEWQDKILPFDEREHDKTLIQVSTEVHSVLESHIEEAGLTTFNEAVHEIFQMAGFDVSDPEAPGAGIVPTNAFEEEYDNSSILHELRVAHPEPLTNKEIGKRVGCSKPTAHNRLHELADEGRVQTKKVGATARVWWVSVEEAEKFTPTE